MAAITATGNTNIGLWSPMNSNISSQFIGGSDYAGIAAMWSYLSATYGTHYLDIHGYLLTQGNPSVPQDAIDVANGVCPGSLRYDAIHFNTAGNATVAAYMPPNIGTSRETRRTWR